jgi:hypothetical protein
VRESFATIQWSVNSGIRLTNGIAQQTAAVPWTKYAVSFDLETKPQTDVDCDAAVDATTSANEEVVPVDRGITVSPKDPILW